MSNKLVNQVNEFISDLSNKEVQTLGNRKPRSGALRVVEVLDALTAANKTNLAVKLAETFGSESGKILRSTKRKGAKDANLTHISWAKLSARLSKSA